MPIKPSDLSDSPIDVQEVLERIESMEMVSRTVYGTLTFSGSKPKPSDNDAESEEVAKLDPALGIVMGTYTNNTGKRTDRDIDPENSVSSNVSKIGIVMGTYTNNGGRRDHY